MISDQPADAHSHLENLFPRIAQALTEKWGTPDVETYLADLMIDNRGTRKGFPFEVVEELILIDTILWELSDTRKRFLSTADDSDFAFGGS
ncbi:hypothetical protein TPL01_27870 [Sulfuriferula plumbiphila]|uniref:Uncharacterized protein n=1 Tax=Sulfuriferula plumbiphila TaxID=171865 RepID=A0A512LAZ2_9PROT|nr:hypothetical protein [Sulfuriferula plumbiphila]BBP03928.1 hypothetical protein SFPGR_13500 [Sulfuriferula plumbiphila]GEP31649.1 hypothetical protein TPL01_27870 [Sulfuriferula plumbiphila]